MVESCSTVWSSWYSSTRVLEYPGHAKRFTSLNSAQFVCFVELCRALSVRCTAPRPPATQHGRHSVLILYTVLESVVAEEPSLETPASHANPTSAVEYRFEGLATIPVVLLRSVLFFCLLGESVTIARVSARDEGSPLTDQYYSPPEMAHLEFRSTATLALAAELKPRPPTSIDKKALVVPAEGKTSASRTT